jgi:hypothetical protein
MRRERGRADPFEDHIVHVHSSRGPDLDQVSAHILDLFQVPSHLIIHQRKPVRERECVWVWVWGQYMRCVCVCVCVGCACACVWMVQRKSARSSDLRTACMCAWGGEGRGKVRIPVSNPEDEFATGRSALVDVHCLEDTLRNVHSARRFEPIVKVERACAGGGGMAEEEGGQKRVD